MSKTKETGVEIGMYSYAKKVIFEILHSFFLRIGYNGSILFWLIW